MGECCRQAQAEVVSNSRDTIHQTCGPPSSQALYKPFHCCTPTVSTICTRVRAPGTSLPLSTLTLSSLKRLPLPPRAITRLHVPIDHRNARFLCSKNKASCNKMNWSCCLTHVPFRILLSARQESHDSHSIMPDLGKIYVSGHHGNSFSSQSAVLRERRLVGSGSMCCVGTKIIPSTTTPLSL